MKGAKPQRVVMDTIIWIPAKVFAETGRRAQELGTIAPKLQHPEPLFLNGLAANAWLRGEQVHFMTQPGQRLCKPAHGLGWPAVAFLKAGDDLGDSHRITGLRDHGLRDYRTTDRGLRTTGLRTTGLPDHRTGTDGQTR